MHVDVAHASGELGANADERARRLEAAVPRLDVFRWTADTPRVAVPSRLENEPVFALIEVRVLDEDVPRHLNVDAVIVEAVRERNDTTGSAAEGRRQQRTT